MSRPSDKSTATPEKRLSQAKQALFAQWRRGQQAALESDRPRLAPRSQNASPAPLSFSQQQVWFFNQLDPNSPLYNIPVGMRLSGPVDRGALQQALRAIVTRHEILRTRFAGDESGAVQLVQPPEPALLREIDLGNVSASEQESKVQQLVSSAVKRPFDLSREVMLRADLIRLSEAQSVLVIVMHHIAADVWSWRVFCRELAAFYNAAGFNELPPLLVQYSDFAVWQRESLDGTNLDTLVGYWRQKLADAPTLLELPLHHKRPAVQSFEGLAEFRKLNADLGPRLETLSQREGVTLFMTLLAAFQTLLHRYTGTEDLLIGSPTAGRSQVEVENLIGNFVNMLVLRTSLSGNSTFHELLQRTRETVLEALAHQDLPFEKLVQTLRPERSSSHSPLIQVMFAVQEELAEDLRT